MAELNPDNPKLLWQLTFQGAWPTAVAFLGSNRLAAANRDGQLLIWELPESGPTEEQTKAAQEKAKDKDAAPSLPPVRQLVGHGNGVTRLIALRDGKTLFSSSLDRTVRLWDMTAAPTGEAEVVLDIEERQREARRVSQDKKDAILNAPGVKVATQTHAHILEGHGDWVNGLGVSRDEKRLISGDDKCHTIVWDLTSRKPIARWDGHGGDWVTSACLSPDGSLAFVGEFCARRGDFDRPPAQARLYDAATGEEKIDLLKVQFPDVKQRDNSYGYAQTWGKFVKMGFIASQFSPDGKLLALGQGGETDKGQVHLINTADGKLVRTVSGHQYGVTDVLFSDDGKYVLSAGRDTTVRICQVEDGKEVAALGKPRGGQFKDWLSAIALSPDQQWVAAADIAGMVHVWRVGAGA